MEGWLVRLIHDETQLGAPDGVFLPIGVVPQGRQTDFVIAWVNIESFILNRCKVTRIIM